MNIRDLIALHPELGTGTPAAYRALHRGMLTVAQARQYGCTVQNAKHFEPSRTVLTADPEAYGERLIPVAEPVERDARNEREASAIARQKRFEHEHALAWKGRAVP